MNISLKLLMLICLSSVTEMKLVTFNSFQYQDICDPQVLLDPETYEANELFEYFFDMIGVFKPVSVTEVQKRFQSHYDAIQTYLQQLQQIKPIMEESELQTQKRHYFREQLIFIRRKIGKFISDPKIMQELSNVETQQDSEGNEIPIPATTFPEMQNTELLELHKLNLNFYVEKLDSLYSVPEEQSQQKLIKNPIIFASKEAVGVTDKSKIYFKNEICSIEELLGKSIFYMLQEASNNSNNAQSMLGLDREIMDSFIDSTITINFKDQFGCDETTWRYLLKHLTPTKALTPDLLIKLDSIKPKMHLFDELVGDDNKDRADLIRRDYNVAFFPLLKNDWSQETINDLPLEVFEKPFSPIWLTYLFGDVPRIMSTWIDFILKKDNGASVNPNEEEINLVIIDLYFLYTIEREKKTLPEVPDSNPEDYKIVLRHLLTFIMGYKPQQIVSDPVDDVLETENRIKLILVIKKLLDWEDLKLDNKHNPTYDELKKLIDQLMPNQEDPYFGMSYLLDNYVIPQNIWDEFNTNHAKDQQVTIFEQMKTLKSKVKNTPKKIPGIEITSDPLNDDEESPFKNVKEVSEIAGNMKTMLFTLVWLKKVSGVKDETFEEEIISNINDIISNTQSRTQLAIFVKSLKDILSEKNLAFNPEEFKKSINLNTKQVVSLEPNAIKESQQKIKIGVSKKLQERLEHNIHYSSGLLKVWSWAGFFNDKFKVTFDQERALFKSKTKTSPTHLFRGMSFDICFLEQATEKYRTSNKGNPIQIYKDMVYAKYQKSLEANYECKKIKKTLFEGDKPKIMDVFSPILMGIRFSNIYNVLDHFEIDMNEEEPSEQQESIYSKSVHMSSHKKRYLGKVLHDIYISQLQFRYNNWDSDYNNPVETFKEQVKACVVATYQRTVAKDSLEECPLDNLDYHEQYNLLAYQRAEEQQVYLPGKNRNQQFLQDVASVTNGNSSKPQQILLYNTILIHIFLLHAPDTAINGKTICNESLESQLCQEFQQISSIIGNEGELSNIMTKTTSAFPSKLAFYNVLITMDMLYPAYFQKLMQQSHSHERTQLSKDIESHLNIQEQDIWFTSWLKINFSNMDKTFKDFRAAIIKTFSQTNPTTQNLIYTEIMSFTNHSAYKTHQDDHLLNLERVLVYLLFSTDLSNYSSLQSYLGDKAWMVLMVYSEKNTHALTLHDVQAKIKSVGNDDFITNMQKYFIAEEDEMIQSIEDDIFGKDSSEESEEEVKPSGQHQKSQQLNNTSKNTITFGGDDSYEEDNMDQINKTTAEQEIAQDLQEILLQFNMEFDEDADFDEVREKLQKHCEILGCEQQIEQLMDQYKNQASKHENLLI